MREHLTLRGRLMLALSAMSALSIGLAALLAHWVTVREVEQFFQDKNRAEFAAAAEALYRRDGGWRSLDQSPLAPKPAPAGRRSPPPNYALVDSTGRVVAAAPPYRLGETLPQPVLDRGLALRVDGRRVGTVLDAARRPNLSERERQFLAAADRALGLAALGSLVLAQLLAAVLARGLVRPLRQLTQAIREVAGGAAPRAVPVRSRDELGELALAFNQMSAALGRADGARRQMTADVAHDLRTPLAVISGHLEGLRDGTLRPTTERFEALHAEARHLQRLVEDLRLLSLADAGELPMQAAWVEPAPLVQRLLGAMGPQAAAAEVTLRAEAAADLPRVRADAERLNQALANLLTNAIRHTPPGGHVTLAARADEGALTLEVRDDGEGMEPAVLERIFDRFYRADGARSDATSSSGLGLAIARSIAQAHGGSLSAASEGRGRGSCLTIRLPLG